MLRTFCPGRKTKKSLKVGVPGNLRLSLPIGEYLDESER
jgi:hypothetical protein